MKSETSTDTSVERPSENSAEKKVKVWYLYHSGFAVETPEHFFLFDYYVDRPEGAGRSLETGVIEPDELRNRNVVVFSSHRHPDHYNPVIWKLSESLSTVRYVLSHDIRKTRSAKEACAEGDKNVLYGYAGQHYDLGDLTVTALQSTDVGVAFLVKADGITLFHAGDLNWWHWEGEPDADNIRMGKAFRGQIDLLRNEPIDLAFFPVDPRLEEHFNRGIDYFMSTAAAKAVFPMHFGEEYAVIGRLKQDGRSAEYRDKIMEIHRRGERFDFSF